MESSVYSQDGSVSLYFIHSSSSTEEISPTLLRTYQACEENGLNPEWVSVSDCLQMNPTKQDVCVIDPFEGEAFKHLTSGFKCIVLGPQCILSCLHRKESIPELPSPIHNTAMKGLVLTCTGFEKEERAELQQRVERMAGIYSSNFHQGVTHVVAKSVGSKKYLVAVEQDIPILTMEWVHAVWRAAMGQAVGQQGTGEEVRATDEQFLSYACPVFKGLNICVSQLDRSTKLALKNIIEENGGMYSTSLDMNTTSVLILPAPEGEKYSHAVNWRIQCLTPDWIHDSVEQGFALQMEGYSVKKRGCSTPTDPANYATLKDFSMCSTIMNETGLSKVTHVDESTLNITMSAKRKDKDSSEVTQGLESIENLDLQEAMRAGLFLDGCKIFLSGFNVGHMEKLRRVVNAGGATRFNQLSEAVSHVVLGKKVDEHLTTIQGWNSQPHIVYADWIAESISLGRPADETQFTHHLKQDTFKWPSTSNKGHSKNNLDTTTNTPDNNKGLRRNNSLDASALDANNETHVDEAVLNQYLKQRKPSVNGHSKADDSVGNTSALPSSQDDYLVKIFGGTVFTLFGYSEDNEQNLARGVEELGGKVVPAKHQGIIDYAITCHAEKDCLNAREMVSRLFIDDCIENKKLLPVEYYHMPLELPSDSCVLEDCTITISAYIGKERVFLEGITTALGGVYQEVFARKSNPVKNTRGSTHLICPEESEGGKYRAAVKWGVPVVTADWLLECASTGTRIPEERFLVTSPSSSSLTVNRKGILRELFEKTVLNKDNEGDQTVCWEEETEDMEVAATPVNKKVRDLKNNQSCSPSEIKTPDPETWRKMYPTPGRSRPEEDILREMKTPDTPYGSTWYPNPSPRTRKRFKLMLDSIPDPPPKAPPRTPLDFYIKKFVADGPEFLKNFKVRKTPIWRRNDEEGNEGQKEPRVQPGDGEGVTALFQNPLSGVVVCTSRKLQEQQKELYKAVEALGGDSRKVYDSSVTHFIFQGRENDIIKDFRQARDDGKVIVAPDWVWMCRDENARIDEELFPHMHNSKKSLFIVGGKSSPVKRNRHKKYPADHSTHEEEKINSEVNETQKGGGEDNKDEEEEERAKISKQLEEIDALASNNNNVSSGRKSVGGNGRSLALTDRMKHTPTKTVNVDTQPVPSEIPESQSTAITWEDPREREARLRLQNQLTKDTQEIISNNQQLLCNVDQNEDNKNVSVVEETHAIKEEEGENNNPSPTPAVPVFMLLGMNEDKERSHYTRMAEELGGTVSQIECYDPNTTHVITIRPSRSERNLSSIASGNWILHESFLEESIRQGHFVEEELFAWGNPDARNLPTLTPGSTEAQLASAAWKWRQLIHGVRSRGGGGVNKKGAFHFMNALVHTTAERIGAFTRLIRAGGGTVVKSRPPFSDVEEVTHFFLELNKISDKVDLAHFASLEIPCLSPIYLSNFLIQDEKPNEADFYVPEYKEILANMSASNHSMIKRKKMEV
ncbi:hypothetical protein Pmani_007486 [Petrolisthes manimaculis]|uniref:BRCT domain-containing protein n=1 Tax=Petrolisthes manimaculis TaxID=1843537 RepID=A0AAE1Q8V7_9EUCA|nr:hypothetical protein Pmani_007486 [Petrolisthes manimaculis]